MDAAFLQKIAAHLLARASFEEYIVRHDDACSPVDSEQRIYVLHEIELLVTGRRPEVLAHDDLIVLLGIAFLVDEQQALLLTEWRIRENERVFFLPGCGQTVM